MNLSALDLSLLNPAFTQQGTNMMVGGQMDPMQPPVNMPEQLSGIPKPPPNSSETHSWKDVMPKEFMDGNDVDQAKVAALAVEIQYCFWHGKNEKTNLIPRWTRNEELVKNRPRQVVAKRPYRKATAYHVPIIGPKLDQRFASIHQILTKPERFFTLTMLGEAQEAKDLSGGLQWHLDNAGWNHILAFILNICKSKNDAILYVGYKSDPRGCELSPSYGPFAGFDMRVIDPEWFVAYPANDPFISNAKMVGHESDRRTIDVLAKQKKKIYMDEAVIGGIQSLRMASNNPGLQLESPATSPDDLNVRLYDVLIKYRTSPEEDEKVYRVIGDAYNQIIYRIEEHDLPIANYVKFSMEQQSNRFWSEDSPANHAQSVQLLFNAIFNNINWGIEYSSRPPVLTTGNAGQDSVKELAPNTSVPVSNATNSVPMPSTMQLAGFAPILQMLLQISDLATKTSNTITGAPSSDGGDSTATEENIRYQGFQIAGESDITALLTALIQTAKLCLLIWKQNFAEMFQTYDNLGQDPETGERIGVTKIDNVNLLNRPMQIFVSGQKPKSAPSVQMEQISGLFNLLTLVPQMHAVIFDLAIMYIAETGIDGKEEIINKLQQVKENEDKAMAAQAAQEILKQHVTGGSQPNQQAPQPGETATVPGTGGHLQTRVPVQ